MGANRAMSSIPILHAGIREPFPSVATAQTNGLLAAGGDLSPQRLLDAYRHGIFPWYSRGEPILWWSPDPRTVFATDKIHVSTRMQRWLRHCDWSIRADTDFPAVIRACAQPRPRQPTTWITREMFDAYCALHELGHAHSIEVYEGDRLVGGLYGVAIGRMFFGESMFSAQTNGSKVALIGLCRALREWGFALLDAQVESTHLTTLGASTMPRSAFVAHVAHACEQPFPPGPWDTRWSMLATRDLVR